MNAKEIRRTFGPARRPIEVTALYSRGMDFDHDDVEAKTHLVINEVEGTYAHVNTYDGRLGRNFSIQSKPLPAPLDSEEGQKWLTKKTKKLDRVEGELPIAFCEVGESQEVEVVESD